MSAITQEDLLCDACRAGCGAAIGTGPDDDHVDWIHIRISDFNFELAGQSSSSGPSPVNPGTVSGS